MDTNRSLVEELSEQFAPLLRELDLAILEHSYERHFFGNSLVVLGSTSFRVRFVRDRGQVFADVAPLAQPDEWWGLEEVCRVVLTELPVQRFDLVGAVGLLAHNFGALTLALGRDWSTTRTELARRRESMKWPPSWLTGESRDGG